MPKIRPLYWIPLALLLLLGGAYLAVFELPYWQTPRVIPVRLSNAHLENGDLVFRNGNSFMSDRIVDLSPEKIELSHAGVLIKRGDKFFVIHIVGDHFENYVKMEALDSFVAHSTGGHFCITRYRDSAEVRNKIAARALAYKKENRAFDYDMTLESKDALFCTELVWRAILEATGKDVSPQKVPWRGKTLIGFLPFFRSPNFEPVYLEAGCPAFQKMASLPEKSALSSAKP